MPYEGVCLGIEESHKKLTFNDFTNNKICNVSMGNKNDDLTRFIFKKIAETNNLPPDIWCWFDSFDLRQKKHASSLNFTLPEIYVSINKYGNLGLQTANTLLPCMACLTEVIYKKTELFFEYNEQEKVMYLTIYYPSGLWKYSEYDRGMQCFTDVKGFAKVIDINDFPLIEVKPDQLNSTYDAVSIEKIVYEINIITDRAAQYWCEGHTNNFSLIKTKKLLVNPLGDEVHVFSLVINVFYCLDDIEENSDEIISELCTNITYIFSAKKVILMEYLNYSSNYLMLLLHMHIAVDNLYKYNSKNIQKIYDTTVHIAETVLPKYNYKFVNLSSSLYCLPTTSFDNSNILDWDLTAIGHIAAPKQFCLQENGLPVKRLCDGSYLLGSFWGDVEGNCNYNYQPSNTTTFLYNFVKGLIPENNTTRFLTDGLGFVLRDVDIIIPADIYYLSMSLQHILRIAQSNQTSIDMGNIENIAWIMDRVMVLNNNYLRLAQTLNSTNVILDSLNNIIEILAYKDNDIIDNQRRDHIGYQIAIKPQFILQISYPAINNVSGIALIKPLRTNDFFTDMIVRPLFINTTLEEVMSIENLEIATWIPNAVLSSLKRNTNETRADKNSVHVIISIFHNDAIFQELESNKYCVNSRIIGVSLPGFSTYFKQTMPLVYRDLNPTSAEKVCGFWNFQPHSIGNVPGYWSSTGCYLKKSENKLTVCECDHLTHFGQLLNFGRDRNNTSAFADKHTKPLNIISLVGSFLSLLGIMGIWITASVFHTWRKKASTKVLLHLSTSIALPLIFMIVFNLDNTIFKEVNGIFVVPEKFRAVCISLGALLHYSVLASFMWMLITAVLQFIRHRHTSRLSQDKEKAKEWLERPDFCRG
ncbi:jg10729 [Pararge aegeria aegeria]|uniref:Jg10729 protein n=1 Tax=Pararge aegeria aegeria TaxID=348720 RepID=A0A8S4RHV0_9NEOP|nr:jg10729 [Pararge aegeria aegeria]